MSAKIAFVYVDKQQLWAARARFVSVFFLNKINQRFLKTYRYSTGLEELDCVIP